MLRTWTGKEIREGEVLERGENGLENAWGLRRGFIGWGFEFGYGERIVLMKYRGKRKTFKIKLRNHQLLSS